MEPMGSSDRPPIFLRHDASLLREAVRAAADPVDLPSLVDRFAELTIQATEAWRATVFLIEDDRLSLWANQSRETDPETRQRNWERGLSLGGIPLDEVPERRLLFDLGEPVAIPDARASELVPASWAETFDLGALVVCPLVVSGEPLGMLVADWPDAREIDGQTVEVIGAVAGSLSLAVGNAVLTRREAERNAALQALLEATTVLGSSAGLDEVAGRLTEPLAQALGATGISICLFEPDLRRWRTLSAWNPVIPLEGSIDDLAEALRCRIGEAWSDGPAPIVLSVEDVRELAPEYGDTPAVILPLSAADGSLLGFVQVTLEEWEPRARAVELAGALTSHLAAAVERVHLQETLALETERLRGLSALWGFETEALEAYSAAIEEAIGPALGFNVVRVSVGDEELRSLAYFSAPDDVDEQLIALWSRRGTGVVAPSALPPGELATPLTVRGRVVGVVRARVHDAGLSAREAEMLETLAAAFGRAIEHEWERRDARQKELDLALADERERVAARLHDTVGRLLYALHLRSGTLRLAVGDAELAEEARQIESLARSGLAGLRRAVATLASMRLDDRGLVPSLERLAADFQDAHEVAVSLAVDGGEQPLPPQVEEALYQVASEALANVERHAQAGSVTISLDRRDEEVLLRVRDDGLGLGRSAAPQGTGLGLELARRALEPVGGALELRDATPGVEVVARVPARPTAVEPSAGEGVR